MTPTQLRAFVTVVRLGSVKDAAAELDVSEAAVSLHIGKLRRELGDQLFSRTAAGLAFTPGGLRLASRAAEMLGLQDRTIIEVSQAGSGRRLLRLAASSLFAEHAAPGLIELFASRANDLTVELSVHSPRQFDSLLHTRAVDIAIGPDPGLDSDTVTSHRLLNYRLVIVVGPEHPLASGHATVRQLREQTWLLGPSAVSDVGTVPTVLEQLKVPEENQQIFQSHAAALEEAKRGKGLALGASFMVGQDVAHGDLVRVAVTGTPVLMDGSWSTLTLAGGGLPEVAAELVRFAATPRAAQAMLHGSGVNVGRFRPSIHVTLWS